MTTQQEPVRNDESSAPPKPRKWRLWRLLLAFLLGLELVYVAGGLILLKTGQVARWINTRPDKTFISFESVWPIVPGVVHVKNFRILNQDRATQLEGKVESVWGAVNPFELLAKRVHVVWLRASGVTFRLRDRPKSAEEAAKLLPGFPEIPGTVWEPYTGPPKGTGPKKEKMTVVFTRSHLDDVRDVWLNERRIIGQGSVVASVTVGGDDQLEISHADVQFTDAKFENGAEETYSDVRFRVLGKLSRFQPNEVKGLAVISLIKARIDLDARMPSGAAFLNVYLRNAPWIKFEGGESKISVHLSVNSGKLAPGGFLELAAHELNASFGGFLAGGKAKTRLDLLPGKESAEARLAVEFEKYQLRRGAFTPDPLIRGEGLRVVASTPGSLAALPPSDFSGRLELGRAEFPSLDFVNALLPAGAGLRFKAGGAAAQGAFDVRGAGSSCKGSMKITTSSLILEAGGVEMKGTFSLNLAVPRGDLLKQVFEIDGTKVSLDKFSFASKHEAAGQPDWSASISLPRASFKLSDPLAVRGHLEISASDSRPVVAFLAKDEPLEGWKKKLVTVGEIHAKTDFALGGKTLEINDFQAEWEKSEVRVRVKLTEDGAYGKALVKAGILKAGIGLEGQKRKLKILRPTAWYEDNPAAKD